MSILAKSILIVAVLVLAALVLFPAGHFDGRNGEFVKAKKEAFASVTALNYYLQEYERFPKVGPQADSNRDVIVGRPEADASAPNEALFDILRTIDRWSNAHHAQNPLKIVFFESRTFDAPPKNQVSGRLYDSWGAQFNLIMDTNGDGQLDVDHIYSDFAGENRPRNKVGAFSFGKDGLAGNKGNGIYQGSDDVVSWR
ncbi:MAG: hypothetical protein ABI680_03985 [Chthoniobacteraceae bacterium]